MKRAMIDVHAALAAASRGADDPDGPRRAAVRGAEDRAEEIAALVRDRMQSAAPLNVPLTVDVGIGAELEGRQELTATVSEARSPSQNLSHEGTKHTKPLDAPDVHFVSSCLRVFVAKSHAIEVSR